MAEEKSNKKYNMNSVEVQLGRIEERLSNFIDMIKEDNEQNNIAHKEILGRMDTLCIHVNHENELMTTRINDLDLHGTEFLRNTVSNLAKNTVEALATATNTTDGLKHRVDVLEKEKEANKAERVGQKKVWIYATGILGLTVTLMTIAHMIGIF